MSRYLLCLALLLPPLNGCATAGDEPAVETSLPPEALIAARRASMRTLGGQVRDIKAAVASGADVSLQATNAASMASFAATIPGLFRAGTGTSDNTKAKREIWANKADFDAKAAALQNAAARLAVLAQAGDAPSFAAQANVVQATCGACHASYKAP